MKLGERLRYLRSLNKHVIRPKLRSLSFRRPKSSFNTVAAMILAHNETPNTPDYWELSQQEFVYVFVADEMMSGHASNRMVVNDDSVRLTAAITIEQFVMYEKTLNGSKYCVPMEYRRDEVLANRASKGQLRGELYAMRPSQLVQLDNYKDNGRVFNRRPVRLEIKIREEQKFMDAVTKVASTPSADKATTFAENITPILGEWKSHVGPSAFMYLGSHEYFFWANFKNDGSFRPLRPKVSEDRLKPIHFYKPRD